MPGPGGYWFSPARIAATAASATSEGPSVSGNPWPRLMEPVATARAVISAKIVVANGASRPGGSVGGGIRAPYVVVGCSTARSTGPGTPEIVPAPARALLGVASGSRAGPRPRPRPTGRADVQRGDLQRPRRRGRVGTPLRRRRGVPAHRRGRPGARGDVDAGRRPGDLPGGRRGARVRGVRAVLRRRPPCGTPPGGGRSLDALVRLARRQPRHLPGQRTPFRRGHPPIPPLRRGGAGALGGSGAHSVPRGAPSGDRSRQARARPRTTGGRRGADRRRRRARDGGRHPHVPHHLRRPAPVPRAPAPTGVAG